MIKFRVYVPLLVFLVAFGALLTGCARKSGCTDMLDTTTVKVRKDGKPKKKASSGLFDKKTRRKMD